MTLDTGRLSSGTATDGTLKMRMHCRSEEKRPSIYGAQLKLQPGKKIELIMEPSNSDYSRDVCQQDHVVKHEKAVDRLLAGMAARHLPMDRRHIDLRSVCLGYCGIF